MFMALLLISSLFACAENRPEKKKKDPILEHLGGTDYAKLIRTPVNEDGSLDTTQLPRIQFEKTLHNFGTLGQEDKQDFEFRFSNPSKHDLYIFNVKTSCGCTVASFDKEAIKPGASSVIKLNYDPKDRKGIQDKKIIVHSNAYPNKKELTILANVLAK